MDYKQWKKEFVSVRGVKNSVIDFNGVHPSFGSGLYTCPISNKSMAKEYGKLYFVVFGKPLKPYSFQTLNTAEIYRQKFDNDGEKMKNALLRAGYDGFIIPGREMCNYRPSEHVLYFENENQLEGYFSSIENLYTLW